MLSNDQKKKISEELTKRKHSLTCPMCQNRNFIMADGYFSNIMQPDFGSISIGGPGIPTIAIVCNNCGFVSQHALGVLELLPKDKNISKDGSSK